MIALILFMGRVMNLPKDKVELISLMQIAWNFGELSPRFRPSVVNSLSASKKHCVITYVAVALAQFYPHKVLHPHWLELSV